MRVPVSWLREYVDLPAKVSVTELANRLTMLGLKLEALEFPGSDVEGRLVVGQVLDFAAEEQSNGKTVRWCRVDTGDGEPRGIVCGAGNFAAGDLVVVALPDAVLPGGFEIAARKTYGHMSDGMICSARELGLGDDHAGILVLGAGEAASGDDAAEVLQLRDQVIEFEINPDRAYALSLRGVAREAATAYNLGFDDPALSLPAVDAGEGYSIQVEDRQGCDRFTALEVTGFNATALTPRWLVRRIQLAGMRPISLSVDVTNYVMLELGQPIHGYDSAKLRGPIVVRRASAGEKLTTLDGVSRVLDSEDLLITDDSGPIGLAGVMGGESTEMSATTTEVLIEAAHFDPATIARSARRHKLPSEASKRFERGIDPTLGPVAALRVAELLTAYGGGTVAKTGSVVGELRSREEITISADLPSRVSGIGIDAGTAVTALRTVGCEAELVGEQINATPPAWRPDITDPYDVVEEVTRIVGYDQVPSILPPATVGRGLSKRQRLRRRVGLMLASRGFVEALNFPFLGESDLSALQLHHGDPRRIAMRLANPLSDLEPLLRTTLLPGLLKALARNAGRGKPDLGLFELGAVFLPPAGERPKAPKLGVDRRPSDDELKELEAALPDQPLHLGIVMAGHRGPPGWWGSGRGTSWADAVEACRVVARTVGVELEAASARIAPWHPGRCAQLLIGDVIIGHAGELHPRVCQQFGLTPRSVAAELDLDVLIAQASDIVRAPTFSTYPVAKEDVALAVDMDVPAAEVEAALRDGAGELLESVRLFDMYVGQQVGAGKKSLGYSLRFRARDRTLTETEIRAAREAAVEVAVSRHGAALRS
ncbi:MAG: phenylalanine--tRNA ligase subunit beta [Nocardioidaceae bacterium]|nr:phenylalanine--tRNA ligase subunit beta [Nocardioidaceae bacterium]